MKILSLRAATLLSAAIMALSVGLTSCSNKPKWSEEERRATREMLRDWREIVYLNNLSEEEFMLFRTRVADMLEEQYPVYEEFIEMPMMGDSVEVLLLATIVTELKASPEKMRHIFPYTLLVADGFLPKGLNQHHQEEFYKCFADNINRNYGSLQQFVWDAFHSRLDDLLVVAMLRSCAIPYWELQ